MSWIKVRVNLWTHPKVVTLASRLSVTKPHAIGGLCALWFVTDQHANDDGRLDITAEAMDAEVQIPGFCAAMESIGWLSIGPDGLQVPRYQEHNGSTGKQRAASQKRSKASRLRNGPVTVERDASVTREEKSREEKSRTKTPRTPRKAAGIRADYSEEFQTFWSSFPPGRKTDKASAYAAWNKAIVSGASAGEIIAAAAEYAASPKGMGEFVKMPASWLNGRCWEDDRRAWSDMAERSNGKPKRDYARIVKEAGQ